MKASDKKALTKAYESLYCPPLHQSNFGKFIKRSTPSKERKDSKQKSKKALPYLTVNERILQRVSRGSNRPALKLINASNQSLELTKSNYSKDLEDVQGGDEDSNIYYDKTSTLNVNSSKNFFNGSEANNSNKMVASSSRKKFEGVGLDVPSAHS